MGHPHICVPRLLTDEQKIKSFSAALRENPLNHVLAAATPEHLALQLGKRWANGKVLHVRFLNGSATQKQKTERHVHEWEKFANIKFVFDNSPNAEIRVAFYDNNKYQDQGSWSYIGTDALIAPSNEQTVNFGWLADDTPDAEYERVAVHEFGHALSALHEDQSPAETIKWNKDVVYKYFEGPPNNWTKADVDDNVLNPTPQAGVGDTPFDPVSIMAYEIPPEFTTDGKGVQGGDTLSATDKNFIGQMYPFTAPVTPTPPVVNPTRQLVVGAPAILGTLDASNPRNPYSLSIPVAGRYQILTTVPTLVVSLLSANGTPLSVGHGHLSFPVQAGKYNVVVSPISLHGIMKYNIMVIAQKAL